MEANSNMSGSITSETDEVGGNGENISTAPVVEVFGNDDSNDIAVCALQKLMYKCKVLCLSSLSLVSVVEQYV